MNSKWPRIARKSPLDSVGLAHNLSDDILLMAQWARINCYRCHWVGPSPHTANGMGLTYLQPLSMAS